MKKGVTELVSWLIIMLIILASGAMLWFWATPLFGKSTEVPYYDISISDCNGTHLYITNFGSVGIVANEKTTVLIYDKDTDLEAAVLDASDLAGGYSEWRQTSKELSTGTYYIGDANMPETPFECERS